MHQTLAAPRMIPFAAASDKSKRLTRLKVNLNSQENESVVTYYTRVHRLLRQIFNLSDTTLLICSFIVVPRELPFLFVQWRGHGCTQASLSFPPRAERVRRGAS